MFCCVSQVFSMCSGISKHNVAKVFFSLTFLSRVFEHLLPLCCQHLVPTSIMVSTPCSYDLVVIFVAIATMVCFSIFFCLSELSYFLFPSLSFFPYLILPSFFQWLYFDVSQVFDLLVYVPWMRNLLVSLGILPFQSTFSMVTIDLFVFFNRFCPLDHVLFSLELPPTTWLDPPNGRVFF
jgi:hypothetical protein